MPVKQDPELALDQAPAAELQEATVARGTVVWGDGISSGPGQTVQLPADDVARLRAEGVLTDPSANGVAAPALSGPTVSAD